MPPLSPLLIVEPDDGLEPVVEFINSAENSLMIKQFTFTEPKLIAAVVDRKKAGVDVRVMLNAQRSGGDRANDETYELLLNAGIAVQWASSSFMSHMRNPSSSTRRPRWSQHSIFASSTSPSLATTA